MGRCLGEAPSVEKPVECGLARHSPNGFDERAIQATDYAVILKREWEGRLRCN